MKIETRQISLNFEIIKKLLLQEIEDDLILL